MKKIYIALFALLAVGSTFTACTEEEPFATVTENDDPHILAPVFPDRTNGQLATFANISRDANLSIALTVTPKDYTTVTWFIDGQEVESGTDSDKEINRSLKAGTYNLKIEVETVKGKKTSREGLVVVNPLADDPPSKEVAFTVASANPLHPGLPHPPQFAPGRMLSTVSILGSSSTLNFCATK